MKNPYCYIKCKARTRFEFPFPVLPLSFSFLFLSLALLTTFFSWIFMKVKKHKKTKALEMLFLKFSKLVFIMCALGKEVRVRAAKPTGVFMFCLDPASGMYLAELRLLKLKLYARAKPEMCLLKLNMFEPNWSIKLLKSRSLTFCKASSSTGILKKGVKDLL